MTGPVVGGRTYVRFMVSDAARQARWEHGSHPLLGAVATIEAALDEATSALAAGTDPVQLHTQCLVTPACGLAGHGESQAKRALGLASELAARVSDQASGADLSLGV